MLNAECFSLRHRQPKRKHRSMSKLAGHFDSASVGFHDCFYDGQPHPCALDAVTLALAAIELVEDHGALHVVNSRAPVGHAGDEAIVAGLAADEDGRNGV